MRRWMSAATAAIAGALVIGPTVVPSADAAVKLPTLHKIVVLRDGHKGTLPKAGVHFYYVWGWHHTYNECTATRQYRRNNYGPMILRNKHTHMLAEDDVREGLPHGWQVVGVCTGKTYRG